MQLVRTRTRRTARSREGAVMLVVMLILVTATAMAAVSLQTTQFELRGSGYGRSALQTQYVSEAGASTTLAWVDGMSMFEGFKAHLNAWNAAPAPPDLQLFGEPAFTAANRRNANRTQWVQQKYLTGAPAVMPPITRPNENNDVVGTLGPRSPYVPGVRNPELDPPPTDYVVDLYDCLPMTATASVGTQVNYGGSGTLIPIQYYCVVTSRGRAYIPGTPTKIWQLPGKNFEVSRLSMSHDSRGMIITPPMYQQGGH